MTATTALIWAPGIVRWHAHHRDTGWSLCGRFWLPGAATATAGHVAVHQACAVCAEGDCDVPWAPEKLEDPGR